MSKSKAYCTCKQCGKQFVREVYGYSRKGADDTARWAEEHSNECKDCYRARIEAEMEKATEGLPQLVGTERQVKWARWLRWDAIKKIDQYVEMYPVVNAAADKIKHNDSAVYWIDTRFHQINDWAEDIIKIYDEDK